MKQGVSQRFAQKEEEGPVFFQRLQMFFCIMFEIKTTFLIF